MRLPLGSVITNVRPKTSSCGSSRTWTPFETQLLKISSTADAGPGTMCPVSTWLAVEDLLESGDEVCSSFN